MKKIFIAIFFLFLTSFSYAKEKETLHILDDECIIVIQNPDSTSDKNEFDQNIEKYLNAVNNTNINVWYVQQDLYSNVSFQNKSLLRLAYFYNNKGNRIVLYKKNKPYYVVSIRDENLTSKVNRYFGYDVLPEFPKRNKIVGDNSSRLAVYINYSEQEIYNMKENHLDENEYNLLQDYHREKKHNLISTLTKLNITYKEADNETKRIIFQDKYNVTIENKGGSVVLYKAGKAPEIHPITLSTETINNYFETGK